MSEALSKEQFVELLRPLAEALRFFVRAFEPMMPHLAQELWAALGADDLVCLAPWPVIDEALLVDDTVTIGVQVNGKLRGTIEMANSAILVSISVGIPNEVPFFAFFITASTTGL